MKDKSVRVEEISAMTSEALLLALTIFGLRILNSAVGTVRMIILTRHRKFLAAVLAFFESAIFAFTAASVVTDLSNMLNLLAYCGGFSIGQYVGLWIEAKFITSFVTVNIVAREDQGHDIAVTLRERGFGVTEHVGHGREGEVNMLRCVVANKEVSEVLQLVEEKDEEAFIAMEEARTVQRGWLRAERQRHHSR